ncbi:zinc-ribbon domain-containing protein [Ktedonobacter sp. SOSP1-52]
MIQTSGRVCTNCGAPLTQNSPFCTNCGKACNAPPSCR